MTDFNPILKGFYSLSNELWYAKCLEDCKNEDFDTAKSLFNYCDMNPMMKRFYSLANELWPAKFLEACKNEDFDTAKSLFNYCYIYLDYGKDQAFYDVCVNGYLKMAHWLYSLGDIDIHINDDVFVFSCYFGRFEVAQWLYSLGNVDIHA